MITETTIGLGFTFTIYAAARLNPMGRVEHVVIAIPELGHMLVAQPDVASDLAYAIQAEPDITVDAALAAFDLAQREKYLARCALTGGSKEARVWVGGGLLPYDAAQLEDTFPLVYSTMKPEYDKQVYIHAEHVQPTPVLPDGGQVASAQAEDDEDILTMLENAGIPRSAITIMGGSGTKH